jgi:hypothetical protein
MLLMASGRAMCKSSTGDMAATMDTGMGRDVSNSAVDRRSTMAGIAAVWSNGEKPLRSGKMTSRRSRVSEDSATTAE